jgi:predicted HicB family RNase H-like nuclease
MQINPELPKYAGFMALSHDISLNQKVPGTISGYVISPIGQIVRFRE